MALGTNTSANPVGGGVRLTPEQFELQWSNAPHKLHVNLNNFEVNAGRAGAEIFRRSFDLGRFNSNGSTPWQRWSKNNRAGNARGSLVESGSLKSSIRFETRHRFNERGVRIYTDPSAFTGTYSHKGFCFAAIHNSDDSSIRTGRVARMPQRQFMPTGKNDSSVFNDELKKLESTIFQNLITL